jgi:hypothetical protein
VEYYPEETAANRYREPLRTNLWDWKEKRLLEWHREKAGTIEAAHDVLKNELAGGVLPCGRYGANAAWFRLAVITYMEVLVLPAPA